MANNRQAETLAYFMANPGEYLDGKTIEECAEFTNCSISTVYNHVRVLKSQSIIKDCGVNVHDPNRRGLYLDTKAYKASMLSSSIIDTGEGINSAQYDVLNDKIDVIINLISSLSKSISKNVSNRPAKSNEAEESPVHLETLVKDPSEFVKKLTLAEIEAAYLLKNESA